MGSSSASKVLAAALCIVAANVVPPASAAPAGNAVSSAKLVADVRMNKPFLAALVFTLDPEWHLYWKNPGDAGMSPVIRWKLPEGWTAGLVEFPVPVKFEADGITSYGHSGEVVLLTRITPGAGRGLIEAEVDWLVCKEECLRAKSTVTLDPLRLTRDSRDAASLVVARAESRLPSSASSASITTTRPSVVEKEGGLFEARIGLIGANARGAEYFFPDKTVGVVIEHSGVRIEDGTIVIPFRRESDATRRFALKGVLTTPKGSYTLLSNVELPRRRLGLN